MARVNVERLPRLRTGQYSDRAVQRHARSSAEIPSAPREGRVAGPLRTRLPDRRQARRLGRSGQGLQYEKGQFVVLTKDDFKTAALEKTKTIDILDFVDPNEIDERYFETPYYLQPAKGAERATRCSARRSASREDRRREDHPARRAASRRRRGHRRCAGPDDDAVCRRTGGSRDFSFPQGADIRPAELKMARQLIDSLSAEWDPEKYTDEYRDNLMKVIKAS